MSKRYSYPPDTYDSHNYRYIDHNANTNSNTRIAVHSNTSVSTNIDIASQKRVLESNHVNVNVKVEGDKSHNSKHNSDSDVDVADDNEQQNELTYDYSQHQFQPNDVNKVFVYNDKAVISQSSEDAKQLYRGSYGNKTVGDVPSKLNSNTDSINNRYSSSNNNSASNSVSNSPVIVKKEITINRPNIARNSNSINVYSDATVATCQSKS